MLNIDKQSRTPVYEQIIAQIERLILTGSLGPDDLIPSVRTLSMDLSINPNTIQKAYNDLERREITYSVPGKGRFVSMNARKILTEHKEKQLENLREMVYELYLSAFPLNKIIEIVNNVYLSEKAIQQKEVNHDNR